MPRKYKHQLGCARRLDYDPQNLEQALEAVVDGGFSFSQASENYGVPKTTLYRKYKGLNWYKMGHPTVLSTKEETAIVNVPL